MSPTTAAAADIKENTVTPPELHEAREEFARLLDRLRPDPPASPEHEALVAEMAALVEQDPTLMIRPEGERIMELVTELARQLRPLGRQVALVREHTRIGADTTLSPTERERAQMLLGKLNPAAESEAAGLRERLRQCLEQLREQVRPDWHTPHGRRRLALERMPTLEDAGQLLAAAAEQLCASVEGALAVDPTLAEAHRVLALADQARALAAPRTCAAHGCAQPLPAAEPGRERRYCSAPCRTRARRAAAKR